MIGTLRERVLSVGSRRCFLFCFKQEIMKGTLRVTSSATRIAEKAPRGLFPFNSFLGFCAPTLAILVGRFKPWPV